jgi:nicotinamide-nucleotide amidase
VDGLAEAVAQALIARGETLAVVEASAGGRLASALTALPGSSRWFLGGAIPYSQQAKTALLGLGEAELRGRGAVADATARLLAEAIRRRLGATWGLAETGVAGPQAGRRSSKPAGLAYVAVAGPAGAVAREVLTGVDDRERNQRAFAEAALALLVEVLAGA